MTDTGEDGVCLGRSSREAPETDGEIVVDCGETMPTAGQMIPVEITGADTYDLRGKML